jgi:RND family efflux transporter MFP subunit
VKSRIILLASFLLLFVACGNRESGLDAEVASLVSVEEIKLGSIEEFITATGTVNAEKEALLKSEIAGFYSLLINPKTKKPFVLGDYVTEGQEIIKLDNPEVLNNIKIESQELNLELSKSEYEKQQSLYDKGGVTLRELRNAERSYIDAQYAYDNALISLAKMKVVAPFDGVIVDLPYYTKGIKVSTNLNMVKIMNYSKLYMDINLPGKDMTRIEASQPVRIMNYTMTEDTLKGYISQVSPAIDPDSRTFKASVTIENPNWLLRPGMFVKADIIVAREDSAIVIPKDIILSRRRGKTVFIVDGQTAHERRITTGLENPDVVQVTEGLNVDERLVVEGYETLRSRAKVRIVR